MDHGKEVVVSTPIRFAVIGCGILARSQHLPNILSLTEARLQTCCDTSEESLSLCSELFHPEKLTRDFREAINDPEVDAVLVATGEHFRLPIYEVAAQAGKPVYTEKPLTGSWTDTLKAREIVNSSRIPFCVGHNRRCSPAMVRAHEIFRRHMENPQPCPWRFQRAGWETIDVNGQDGVPAISLRVNDDWHSWKSVHLDGPNAKYGLLLAEMTHFADLASWFLASEPTRVFAMHNGVLNHSVSIEYANGGIASIFMAGNGSFGYPKELLEAFGNGGAVICDHMLEVRTAGIAGAPRVEKYPMLKDRHPAIGNQGGLHGWLEKRGQAATEAVAAGDPMQAFTAEPDKGHARMLREFIREIRGERGPVSPLEDAIRATRICLAAMESAEEQRPVNVA